MINLDTGLRAARMIEAGRLTATFTSERTGQHITIAAKCRRKGEERWEACGLSDAMVLFIEVPNESGFGDKVGKVTRSKGFTPDPQADKARVYCAQQLLGWLAGSELPDGLTVVEEERCGKCGRALTDPVSIERGIGPECFGASTGSKHQEKQRPAKRAAASDGLDKKGVPYGVGDWKARKKRVDQTQKLDRVDALLGPAPAGAYDIPY